MQPAAYNQMQKQLLFQVDYKCNSMKSLHSSSKRYILLNNPELLINSYLKNPTPQIIQQSKDNNINKSIGHTIEQIKLKKQDKVEQHCLCQRKDSSHSITQKKQLTSKIRTNQNSERNKLKSKNSNQQLKIINQSVINDQKHKKSIFRKQISKFSGTSNSQMNSIKTENYKCLFVKNYQQKNDQNGFKIPKNQLFWGSSMKKQITDNMISLQYSQILQKNIYQTIHQYPKFTKYNNKKKLSAYNTLIPDKAITEQKPLEVPSPQKLQITTSIGSNQPKAIEPPKINKLQKNQHKVSFIPSSSKLRNLENEQKIIKGNSIKPSDTYRNQLHLPLTFECQKYLLNKKKQTTNIKQRQSLKTVQQVFEVGKIISLNVIGSEFKNRFRIIKKITQDQKTSTFLVLQTISKCLYCLKKCQIQHKRVQNTKTTHLNKLQHLIRQAKIGQFITHPFLIKTYCTFADTKNLYHLMQYIEGETLYNQNRNNFYLQNTTERDVYGQPKRSLSKLVSQMSNIKEILYQLLSAVSYLHERGIIHRDLKPANILITHRDTYKICDFGSSILNHSSESIGTLDYAAPQIMLREPYNSSIDMWSLGCIAFELQVGYPPFFNQNRDVTVNKTIGCDYQSFKISDEDLSNLIGRLLEKNSGKRITAKKALQHSFFKEINQI